MPAPDEKADNTPLPGTYSDLLGEAAEVSANALGRLHGLHDRFPAALSPPVVDQLDRAHADPESERRGAIRLPATPTPVQVRADPYGPAAAAVVDRSPGGLALRVGVLLLPGAVITVRLPAGGGHGWFPVQVLHARPDRGAWVVGCAFVTEHPTV